MKYILLVSFLAGAVGFAACKKEPPTTNLSSDFVVLTNFDTAVDFGNYKTFAIRDTIAISTGNPKDSIWCDSNSEAIIQEFAANMQAAGYTRVLPGGSVAPDLGVQLIGIRNTTIYIQPGYWDGLPGYADGCYWGNCYPYYYPYNYYYSVSTGSLTMQMVDLKNAVKKSSNDMVWTGNAFGQIGDGNSFFVQQCLRSVDQAFAQSNFSTNSK